MNLHMFEKISYVKRESGKNYVVIYGLKEFCMPFCYLAKNFNFQVDGVIVIDDENQLIVIMDYIDGISLDKFMEQKGALRDL